MVKGLVLSLFDFTGHMVKPWADAGYGGDAFDMANMVEAIDAKILTADERTKLSGIETGADKTDATNVAAAGAVMESDTSTADMSFVGTGSDLSTDPDKLAKRGDVGDAIEEARTPIFATKADAEAFNPDTVPDFLRVAGAETEGDGGEALYAKVAAEPSHDGKLQTADATWFAYSVPGYERMHGSVLDRVRDAVAAKDFYFYRNADDDIRFGWAYGGNTATGNGDEGIEFSLKEDNDGFLRIRGVFAAGLGTYDGARAANQTGTGFSGSDTTDNYYTDEVGDTWDATFTGTGVLFRCLTNDQGGVWQFTVAKDTPFETVRTVSTYNATSVDNRYFLVAAGLPFGTYTIEAEFLGDDPDNVPSGGADTARGWFKYDSVSSAAYTIFGIGEPRSIGTGDTIASTGTVQEFAIRATPSGSGFTEAWVPDHASGGATKNITRAIYVDGTWVEDIKYLPGEKNPGAAVRVVQEYDAYNANDASLTKKMWDGVITHLIDRNGVTVTHSIEIANDIDVSTGYMAMLSAEHPHVQRAVLDNGERIFLSPPDSGSETTFVTLPSRSAALVNYQGSSGRVLAVEVSSINDALRSHIRGQGDGRISIVKRDDGNMKVYFRAFNNETLAAGEKYSIVTEYVFAAALPAPELL